MNVNKLVGDLVARGWVHQPEDGVEWLYLLNEHGVLFKFNPASKAQEASLAFQP